MAQVHYSKSQSEMSSSNSKSEGNFAGVPHEMTEILMRLQLSGHETRLLWFFIRQLQGYQMEEKLIHLEDMVFDTGLRPERVCNSLKSLLDRKIIKRRAGSRKGEYAYRWNEKFFGRTHATKTIKTDPKITRLDEYRSKKIEKDLTENRNSDYENPQSPLRKSVKSITENCNSQDSKPTPIADLDVPKDSIKDKKYLKDKKKSFNFFQETKNRELSEEDKTLQLNWLKVTDGKIPFDEWRRSS